MMVRYLCNFIRMKEPDGRSTYWMSEVGMERNPRIGHGHILPRELAHLVSASKIKRRLCLKEHNHSFDAWHLHVKHLH
jgi:hypothetical protein